jgi:hypothetical protein
VRLQPFERRLRPDLDAAPAELAGGILGQPRRDLGQDPRRQVDEHPPLRLVAKVVVVAKRIADEIRQLSQRLHTRVAGADEDEGQLATSVA